ncbi:MAG: hypothetical protein KF762_08295 [Acidobacteria bacterium]|jgi:hypothetical protein|nr:hypothetical protein [Acidobacteriota bacterium]
MSVTAENLIRSKAGDQAGELSFFSYVWKCVVGAEVVYFVCLLGAFVLERTANGGQLHHTLFETLPGFVWLTPASVLLGAVYILISAAVFGTYMVWMHNSSIK